MARSASSVEDGADTRMNRALASAREPSVESAVRSTATMALVVVVASASTPSGLPDTAHPAVAGSSGRRARRERRMRVFVTLVGCPRGGKEECCTKAQDRV